MPLDQFPAICEALRSSGYRPIRIRPFNVPITLRRDAVAEPHAELEEYYVSAIWTRDKLRWELQPAVTKSQLPGPDSPATKNRTPLYRRMV